MRISKANQKLQQQLAAQRQVQHFGLRKLSVGVASVLLSTSLYFGAASVAHAATGTPSGEAASVDTATVTSGVANQASTATLPKATANEAPVDDEVTSAADQTTPSSAVDLKDATPVGDRGGAPVGDEVTSVADQTTPSSAVDLKDATPSVNRRVALKALVTPKVAATSQYDVDDIYNYYHDKGSKVSKDRIQKLVDYKNNLASVTAILNLKQTDYGSGWVDEALEKRISIPTTFTDAYVDKIVSTVSQKLVKDTNQKIDAQLVKLAGLQEQYPNDPDVKKAIDELTNAKAMVTPDTILDANRMESVIEMLNKYSPGNNQALDEAKKNAKAALANLKNLTTDQKKAAQEAIEAATDPAVVKAAQNTATTLDGKMGELKTAVDQAKQAQGTGNYTNADPSAQQALNDALTSGEGITANGNTPVDTVDTAIKTLTEAMNGLNGDKKLADAKTKAQEAIANLNNLTTDQKTAAKKAIEAATDSAAVSAAQDTATTLDNKMGALKQAVDQAKQVKDTGNYTNADTTAQQALNDALTNGEVITANGNTPVDTVDAAIKTLTEAMNKLNGDTKLAATKTAAKEVINGLTNLNQAQKEAALAQVEAATTVDEAKNYAATTAITLDDTMGALQKAVTNGNNGKFTDPKYYNADATTRAAYDKALSNAQVVLDDANATQAQIDQAKADLAQAVEALTGKATDKSALQATYNQANVAAKTTAYTNANDTIKRAYEKALSEAQAVLADANATQAQVDLAKAALDEIMALLKGASGDATVAKNSSGQSDQNGLSKAATAIDGKNTTPTTSSASKQNQLPQTGAADDASLVAADLGLTLASMLLGLGAKLKRRQN